jgi:hypothetical protein
MSLSNRTVVLLIVILAFVTGLLATDPAWAQEKQKFFFKAPPGVTKYTQQHALDVGNVPGHQIRIWELHAKYAAEAPVYDGVKVTEAWGRGFSDITNGSGRSFAYTTSQLENGDKIFSTSEVLIHTVTGPDGARQSRFNSVVTLTGGTGKFKGIRGMLRGTGFTDFKTGTSDSQTEGEYWIEK